MSVLFSSSLILYLRAIATALRTLAQLQTADDRLRMLNEC